MDFSGVGSVMAAGVNAVSNFGIAGYNNKAQQQARRENFEYNELAADNALKRQYQLEDYLAKLQQKQYYDLESPKAIMQQLKDAGLSPSLYAQGAANGGGTTIPTASAPQGGGASGLGAVPADSINFAGSYLAMAQADLAHEQANALRGENPSGEANIEKALSEAGLNKAKEAYTNGLKALNDVEVKIKTASADSIIHTYEISANKAAQDLMKSVYETVIVQNQAEISSATIQQEIERKGLVNKKIDADTILSKSNVKLNDTRIQQINAEIEKWQTEIMQNFMEIAIKSAQEKDYATFVKNLDEWQDAQAENLENRLKQDEDHFSRKMRLEWTQFIYGVIHENMANFSKNLMSVLAFLK